MRTNRRVISGRLATIVFGFGWLTLANAANVDLGLNALSLSPTPRIGTNWNWLVMATNRGAFDATGVKLQCPIPTNTSLIQSTSTLGSIVITGGVLQVFASNFPAGSSFSLSYALRPATGGWTTNNFNLSANESDVDPADNQTSVVGFVGPSGTMNTNETLRLPVKQLTFDGVRQMVYALERTTATNQTQLYQLDPITLQPQVLRTLPGAATHLRLTADARFLYAAIQGGRSMQRIDLLGVEPDLVFESFNPAVGLRYRFFDFEPDPNNSHTILVAVSIEIPAVHNYDTTAACFTDGVQQPKSVTFREYFSTPGNQAKLAIDSAQGIATLATDAYPNRTVERLRLTPTGVELINQYNYTGLAAGFKLVDDHIFSGAGEEVLAETGRRLRSLPTSQTGSGVLDYSPANDRLFLTQSGASGRVQIFDRLSFGRLGVINLTSPGTIDSSLVLPGSRLLLAGPDGRLWVVTHTLVASPANADLSVQVSFQPAQPLVNQSVQFTIAVTNLGPSNAVTPAVTFESPASFSRTSVTPAAAASTGSGYFPQPLLWTPTTLAPGQGRVFQVQGNFFTAGTMRVAAGASDSATDPVRGNNRVESSIPVPYVLSPGQGGRLAMKALDAIYDPARHAILAIPSSDDPLAGQLVAISTSTGLVISNWTVGTSPVTLVLADDQQTLYVVTDGGSNIARVSLPSMQVQSVFSAAPDALPSSSVKAAKLALNPGSPNQLMARRTDGKLALYTADVFQFASNYAGSDFVFFAPDRLITPKQSFSFDLYRYRVVGSTLQDDGFGGPIQIQGLRAAMGFVFATDGRLVDPFNLTQAGVFAWGGTAAVEPTANMVFFPGSAVGDLGIGLISFDLHTQSIIKDERFGTSFGQSVVDLFRADGELFVTRYSAGELIVMQSTAIPIQPPADLTIGVSTSGVWKAGLACEWFVTVTNLGPNRAPATRVDMRMPDGMYFVQASVPAISAAEPQASVLVGDLEPGHGVLVRVQAIAQSASFAAELVVSTRSAAADPQMTNNYARLSQPIEASQIPDRVDFFKLPAGDALFDPISKMLFLACPQLSAAVTNALVVLDPAHGVIQRQVTLPGPPGKLAVSSGGEFLYVSLNAADQVLRLTLPNLETNLFFSTVPVIGPQCDMAVLPGTPTSLAFSRFGGGTPSPAGVWIYDDGLPRSNSVAGGYGGVTFMDLGATSNTLAAVDYTTANFRPLTITSDGVVMRSVMGDAAATTSFDFGVGGSNLLTGDQVFNRSTFVRRGILPVPFAFQASAISSTGDRAVFVAGSNLAQDPVFFAGFRTDTLTLTGSTRTRGMPISFQKLVLWGTNGIAALGDGYLFLGRLGFAGPPTSDTDGDGMLDDWELEHSLNPSLPDATGDLDLDGASNLAEYYFGTDPQKADSAPQVQMSVIGGKLRLIFPCAGGRHYYVERASDPATGPWTTVADAVSAGGLQFCDHGMAGYSQLYFRVRITP